MYIFFATAPRKVQVILLKVFPSGSEKLGATPLGVKYIWIFITIIYRRRWASSFSGRKAINFGRKWPVLFFHSVRTLVRRPISPWSIYCKIWLYFTDKYEFTDILIVFQSSTTYCCDNFVFTFIHISDFFFIYWCRQTLITCIIYRVLTNFKYYYFTMVQDKRNLLHGLVWVLKKNVKL